MMQFKPLNYYWTHWAYVAWLCFTSSCTVLVLLPIIQAPFGSFVGRMYGELPILILAFLAAPCLQHGWKDFRYGWMQRDAAFGVKGLIAVALSLFPIPAYAFTLNVIGAMRHLRFGI